MLGRLPSLFFFFFSFPFLNSSCDLFCVVQLSLTAGAFPSIWGLNYYIYWGWNMQRLSALNFKKAEWFHVPLFVWFRTGSFCGYQGDHHWQEPPFHWRFLLGSLKERKRFKCKWADAQFYKQKWTLSWEISALFWHSSYKQILEILP